MRLLSQWFERIILCIHGSLAFTDQSVLCHNNSPAAAPQRSMQVPRVAHQGAINLGWLLEKAHPLPSPHLQPGRLGPSSFAGYLCSEIARLAEDRTADPLAYRRTSYLLSHQAPQF